MQYCLVLIFFLFQKTEALQLHFENTIKVKKTNEADYKVIEQPGDLTIDKDSAYFIINSQNIPLLLISSTSSDARFEVTDSDFNKIFEEKTAQLIENKTNEIINSIRSAESLMLKKDFKQAAIVIDKTKDKHKNISSLFFLSGSLQRLLNNKKTAIEDLEQGLKIDPTNKKAEALLKQLKGGSP